MRSASLSTHSHLLDHKLFYQLRIGLRRIALEIELEAILLLSIKDRLCNSFFAFLVPIVVLKLEHVLNSYRVQLIFSSLVSSDQFDFFVIDTELLVLLRIALLLCDSEVGLLKRDVYVGVRPYLVFVKRARCSELQDVLLPHLIEVRSITKLVFQ